MKKYLILGFSLVGFLLLAAGGYETVNTVSTIMYLDIIRKVKKDFGLEEVPDALTLATIDTESSFDPEAVKTEFPDDDSGQIYNDASVGLMQTLYTTAQGLGYAGDIWGLQEPAESIRWGTKYQLQLYKKYGDWDAVIHAYNEGPGNYDKGKRVPLYYAKVKARWIKWSGLLAAQGDIVA
jgi:soluble lytic murein transglycosylase-like protein